MKKGIAYIIAIIFLLLTLAGIDSSILFISTIVIVALIWFKKNTNDTPLKYTTMDKIDSMTGDAFEHYCAKLLRNAGYKADVTQSSSDFGADVVASRTIKGRSERTVVQCKRYRGKVGIGAVQEIVAAKAYYKAQKAMVITNNYFTDAAKKLAVANKVTLWDRDELKTRARTTKTK